MKPLPAGSGRDARRDVAGAPRRFMAAVYAGFLLLFAGFWAACFLAPAWHGARVVGEDRAVEWITFAGFLAAFGLCAAALRAFRRMDAFGRAYMAGLALFFFMCAGEEISWGQRVFGFATPERVLRYNEQGEFNLHNLDLPNVHPKDLVSWYMKSTGLLLPLVLRRRLLDPSAPARRYLPPPAVVPCFVVPEAVNLLDRTFGGWLRGPHGAEGGLRLGRLWAEEMVEMYWGLCALLVAWFLYRAWRRPAAPRRP